MSDASDPDDPRDGPDSADPGALPGWLTSGPSSLRWQMFAAPAAGPWRELDYRALVLRSRLPIAVVAATVSALGAGDLQPPAMDAQPYSPRGLHPFLTRAKQALRLNEGSRIILSYGRGRTARTVGPRHRR